MALFCNKISKLNNLYKANFLSKLDDTVVKSLEKMNKLPNMLRVLNSVKEINFFNIENVGKYKLSSLLDLEKNLIEKIEKNLDISQNFGNNSVYEAFECIFVLYYLKYI